MFDIIHTNAQEDITRTTTDDYIGEIPKEEEG